MKIEFVDYNSKALNHDFHARALGVVRQLDVLRGREYGLEFGLTEDGNTYVQVTCQRPDTYTGEFGTGRGGRRILSPEQSDSSIVRTVFAAFIAYEEHEMREGFQYQGKRVFGPHIDVDALVEVADRIEKRP